MNSATIAGTLSMSPEFRYTGDNQTPVCEAYFEIAPLKEGEPTGMLKVVAWGERAKELQSLAVGSDVIIEGRLAIHVVDRPEGFRDKKIELVASKFHLLHVVANEVVSAPAEKAPTAKPASARTSKAKSGATKSTTAGNKATGTSRVPVVAGSSTDDPPF